MTYSERVARALKEYDRNATLYARLGAEVERLLNDLLGVSGLSISSVTHRLKERSHFERKIGSAQEFDRTGIFRPLS